MNFVCPKCDTTGLIVSSKQKTNAGAANTSSPMLNKMQQKDTNKQIIAKLNDLEALMNANCEKTVAKIDEVKAISEEGRLTSTGIFSKLKSNEAIEKRYPPHAFDRIDSAILKSPTPNRRLNFQPRWGSQNMNPSKNYDREYPPYSTVMKQTVTQTTPSTTNKRKHNELALIENATMKTVAKATLPEPKTGKNALTIGKPLEPKKQNKRIENPLSKSIWVSGVHPETEAEEIENYIVNNTSVTDKTRIKCTKLIKKDQDISKLSFISFKIDTLPDDFEVLMNDELWPSNIKIREFLRMTPPKRDFGSFLPTQSNAQSPQSPARKRAQSGAETNETANGLQNDQVNGMDFQSET